MVDDADKPKRENGGSDRAARAAQRAVRRESRVQKRAARTKKDGTERPTRLCSLETIQVVKDSKGYQIIGSEAEKRWLIPVAQNQLETVLRDLEVAINVIRARAGATVR